MIKNIFEEFIKLYYTRTGDKTQIIRDTMIKPGIIARKVEDGIYIYYLLSGFYIRIPWDISDLFQSLNTYSGDRLLFNASSKCEDNIDQFIIENLKLICFLNRNDGDGFLNTLSRICDLGTFDFVEWYEKNYNKVLGNIELFSPKEHKTI